MANMNINTEKILSASNIKRIIMLGISIRDKLENAEKGLISEYDSTQTYTLGMSCDYNNYLYECKYTTTGNFDESKWEKIGDELSLIDKQTLASMINLSDEEIASLQSLISTEIRLDKCFSSSDTYNRILNAENNCKTFTMEQLAKKMGASYKVVADTTGVDSTEFLYLIPNGSNGYDIYALIDGMATKIGDTTIDLSQFYTKEQIDSDFLKKTDADGKYTTQTSFNSHTSDTDIHTSATEKASYVKKTDIVDNLTSTDTDKPLSANQGRLLNSMVLIPGVVLPYAGSSVPTGFLLCNGQAVSRTDYPQLFDAIGTTYGDGDGSTTFNLPNLQNKFIEGAGTNAVGTEMSAGLPNITGRAGHFSANCMWEGKKMGAFKIYGSISSKQIPNVAKSGTGDAYYFDFDASLSNSIYGNSTTVQPPAVVMNYIIKY